MAPSTSLPTSSYRPFVITFTFLSLLYNLSAITLLHHLPVDTTSAHHLSLYTYFSTLLSLIGFYGSLTSSASHLLLFAKFQLVDTILTAIPTLVALALAAGHHELICSMDADLTLGWEAFSAAHGTFDDGDGEGAAGCREVVWTVSAVGGLVVLAVAGIRVGAAVLVRKWGWELKTAAAGGDQGAVEEKAEVTIEWRDEKRAAASEEASDEPALSSSSPAA